MAPAILPARRPYEVDDYTCSPLQRGGNAWVYTCLLATKAPAHLDARCCGQLATAQLGLAALTGLLQT